MEWTLPKVIGHNVRQRRDALGITAAALGEKVGEVFGKPWPRQTVYLMENGDRAMVAAEVAALAKILDVTVADLFTPPAEAESVTVGTLIIPAEELAAPLGGDADMEALAHALRALDRTRGELSSLTGAQQWFLGQAKAALQGKPAPQPPKGEGVMDEAVRFMIASAEDKYAGEHESNLKDLEDVLGGEDDGEGN